jgi:hypothetical protein
MMSNDIMRDMGIRGSIKPFSHNMGKGEFRSILRDLFKEEFDIEWDNGNKEYKFYGVTDWDENLEERSRVFYKKYKNFIEYVIVEYVYFDPTTSHEIYIDKTMKGYR